METFYNITPNKNLVLGLGYFDGIHKGHKKIIQTVVDEAKKRGVKSAVITFKKNPADYFKKQCTLNIQTSKNRREILESLGVDYLYELDFENLKDLSAKEYLNNILIKNFEPKVIVAGYNHTFGKQKQGNGSFLKEESKIYGYDCIIIPEQKHDNKKISSTIIRKYIQQGKLNEAAALLERPFSIQNEVIKGDGIAKNLGFPTANLKWSNKIIKLPYGVYFANAKINSKNYHALANWGIKPTLYNKNKELLEAFIHDFDEDIYAQEVEISFIKKIRDEKKFDNIEHLKKQLKEDYKTFLNLINNK